MEKRVISVIILLSLTAVLTYYSLLETWMEAENLESAGDKEEIEEVFQINTKWDWISFCERVNKGERTLDAILYQDIDLKNEKMSCSETVFIRWCFCKWRNCSAVSGEEDPDYCHRTGGIAIATTVSSSFPRESEYI